MNKMISIDDLMLGIGILVIALRNGDKSVHGEALYQKGVELIESAQQQLSESDVSEDDMTHMIYALCALLDETVLSRPGRDNGHETWSKTLLQTRFFNTHHAGERLFERIRQVLNQSQPSLMVLTCFQRVLALGFQGGDNEQIAQERQSLLDVLTQRAGEMVVQPYQTIQTNACRRQGKFWRSRSLWFWGCQAMGVIALMWLGLHFYLQQYLSAGQG
ncbi:MULTISPECIES: type VI secretion system protein TssL, short form [Photorhabdus]|uniref:Membrane protein n=2 Tax=Photorhabdus asymbiotica TaxID=291112 RepID=C7BMP4_PHOAA|nr:type VI secretion system protein TssL, short form [Photorhabdus asymbiotica]RKS59780.1 type VI secretion system protein ImpK [Photorhabdus asymbiotica]CAQ85923.1 putative membrane protein [Photorhabdus asymbiotica]